MHILQVLKFGCYNKVCVLEYSQVQDFSYVLKCMTGFGKLNAEKYFSLVAFYLF